jgi:hypothetical protein
LTVTTTPGKEAVLIGLITSVSTSVSGQGPPPTPAYKKGEQVRLGVWDNNPTAADEAYYRESSSSVSLLPYCNADLDRFAYPILKGKGFVVTDVP